MDADPSFVVLRAALAAIESGRWIVGVSGGADSVALLCALREFRSDLQLIVAHLNHQTRGEENELDAAFVESLCERVNVDRYVEKRSNIEASRSAWPRNPSARFRSVRIAFFAQLVRDIGAHGVLLAHHRDDQAETVLQRVLHSSSTAGLCGMSPVTVLNATVFRRPLLGVGRATLRDYLANRGQSWREDTSNASDKQERNRLRKLLAGREALCDRLIEFAECNSRLRDWARVQATQNCETLATDPLVSIPRLIAMEMIRAWLRHHGIPARQITGELIERMLEFAQDAALPTTLNLPGARRARRRKGHIELG